MGLNVIKYAMPSGIPGAISRVGGGVVLDVEPVALSKDNPLPYYGLFGQINAADGVFRAMAAGDANVYGALSRPYPANQTTTTGYFGSTPQGTPAVPPQNGGEGAVMRAGYMTVKLYNATAAAKNGIVYVRVNNPTADLPLGGCEAADDGADTIAINAVFQGPADENGNTEISFNISKN